MNKYYMIKMIMIIYDNFFFILEITFLNILISKILYIIIFKVQ